MAEVFINYRTGDGDEAAELIASNLSERFGKEHVFKASHSLQPGELYPQALSEAARRSEVLLAVMGPAWPGLPQLRDEADWVRKEILAAQSSGASVVPVLKGRKTDRLVRGDLPPELRWLADVHSLRLDTHDSRTDLRLIGDFLADLVPTLKAADRSAHDAIGGSTTNSANNTEGNVMQGRDFSGDIKNINLSGSHGPTTIGDNSTQNNFLSYVYSRLKSVQIHKPDDHIRRLADMFVAPPGFYEALAAIKEPGTVVLTGLPGSGRTAAAQMLLFMSSSGKGGLYELAPLESDEGSPRHIDPDYIGPDDGVWVDLSRADPRDWNQFQYELPGLHSRVQECNARLVVIQPHWLDLRSDFLPHAMRIDTLQPTEVFNHLVRAEGLMHGDDIPVPNTLKSRHSVDDVRQFVDAIKAAKEQSGGKSSLNDWIAAADQPTSPRESRVSGALAKLSLTSERALFLSVAMLHGAHADVIDRAAVRLLAKLPGESDAALERPPLGERLREVDAEIDTSHHVRFNGSGYEADVRHFFWRHFPELHKPIANWVTETLDSRDLTDDDRAELARGFATQCLDDRYQSRWTALVEHLTAPDSTPSRGPSRELAAAAILQVGLSNEASSRTFRRQIYDWSTANRTSGSLATVLAVACRQMTETHPGEALVRLHHLVRRNLDRNDIRDVLVDIVYGNTDLLRLLLSRLADRHSERTKEADAHIFLDIADPAVLATRRSAGQALIAHDDVTRQLAANWALAFSQLSSAEWTSRAYDWFRHAAEDNANRHALLNVLIDGARRDAATLPQLYGLAYHAAFRDLIADLLLKKISAVQGVELP